MMPWSEYWRGTKDYPDGAEIKFDEMYDVADGTPTTPLTGEGRFNLTPAGKLHYVKYGHEWFIRESGVVPSHIRGFDTRLAFYLMHTNNVHVNTSVGASGRKEIFFTMATRPTLAQVAWMRAAEREGYYTGYELTSSPG